MPTLIFDCDGVLADTEQHGHLPAFNATFEHFELDVRWSLEDYSEKVRIGGGKERLASLLTPEFVAANDLPSDPDAQTDLVAQWHRYKTQVYTRMVGEGAMPPRPGIPRLIDEVRRAGWRLAVASTSARPSVRAVLTHAVGEHVASEFDIFAGDDVSAKKPAPDIYLLALSDMGVDADQTVVVEDSENGCRAAVAAGLRTIVTVSSLTRVEDFEGASLVVTELGDPDGPGPEVLDDPLGLRIDRMVELGHLEGILRAPRPRSVRWSGAAAR